MTCLCEKLFVKHYGIDMNGMPEHADNLFDRKNRQQIHGVLLKRSNAQSKWMRRFFIVRDGWMFYYPETEKKEFPRRNFFNTAPKAAIPLGVCNITVSNKEQGQPSAFIISSEEIEGNLTLAAENDYERDKWISVLEKSKRITWANQQMSDDLIRQLEEHGLTLAKQKQDYFDRLQSEVLELADEKEKTWELERLNEELEKEKAKMESFAEEMKTDYEKVKNELEDMQSYMKSLDTERLELREQLTTQETDLKALATEKESIEATLKRQESVTEQISHEKEQISHEKEKISHEKEQTEEQMKTKLRNIEEQTQILLQEKAEAEMRLQENEQRARELEEEKTMYNEQAQELQSTIKDLTVQKEMTENELKEEIMARMEAERRLKNAESSLHKLHHAVENETPNIESEVKQEMVVNVNKLKAFFENLAQEAKLDPDKPVVMKNSIHARKTIMRRNKTRKFERRKSSSMRAKSMNLDQLPVLTRGSKTFNPRRAQSTFVRSSSKTEEDDSEPVKFAALPPMKEVYTERF